MFNVFHLFRKNKPSKYQLIKENLESKLPNLRGDIYNLDSSLDALRKISREIDHQFYTLKGKTTDEERVEIQDILYHDFFEKCYQQIKVRFEMVHELGKDNAVQEITTLDHNIERAIMKITEIIDYPQDLQKFNDFHLRAAQEYIEICESIINEISTHLKLNNLFLYTYFNKKFVNKYTALPTHKTSLADQADKYFTVLYLLEKKGLNNSEFNKSDQHTLNNLLCSMGATSSNITVISPYYRTEFVDL